MSESTNEARRNRARQALLYYAHLLNDGTPNDVRNDVIDDAFRDLTTDFLHLRAKIMATDGAADPMKLTLVEFAHNNHAAVASFMNEHVVLAKGVAP